MYREANVGAYVLTTLNEKGKDTVTNGHRRRLKTVHIEIVLQTSLLPNFRSYNHEKGTWFRQKKIFNVAFLCLLFLFGNLLNTKKS